MTRIAPWLGVGLVVLATVALLRHQSIEILHDERWLAFASCNATILKTLTAFDQTIQVQTDSYQPRSPATMILEGCMADHGFLVQHYQCNNILPDNAGNVTCYFKPYARPWDAVWRDNLQAEIEADYKLAEKLKREKTSN